MKVLHLLLDERVGGMEKFVSYLAPAMAALGDEVSVEYLDDSGVRNRGTGRLARVTGLRRRLRTTDADVVFAHSAIPALYARAVAPRRLPVVSVLHSGGDDFTSRSLRWAEYVLAGRTAAVVGISADVAERYGARFRRAKAAVHCIPNGVPAAVGVEKRTSLRRFVSVARVIPQKRIHVLLDAVDSVDDSEWGGMCVDVVGPPGDRVYFADLQQRIESSARLRQRVRLVGPVGDVAATLHGYDAMVHPSSYEGLSIALLEGAQAGLPIVAAEPVLAGFGGVVPGVAFRSDDAADLAKVILGVRDQFGEHAARASEQVVAVNEVFGIAGCASAYRTVALQVSA